MRKVLLYCFLAVSIITAHAFDPIVYDFTKRNIVKPFPRELAASLTWGEEGYQMNKTADQTMFSAYFYLQAPADAKAMKYAFTYRNSPGAIPQLNLSFNKKGGANGSNGMTKASFPSSTEWATHEVLITIPAGTEMIQCIHSAMEDAYELAFKSVTVTYLSDTFDITPAPNGFSAKLPPSQWQGVPELPGFYLCVTAEPAREQTSLKLTWDNDALYVGFMANIKSREVLQAKVKDSKPDAAIFSDDCLELFLHAPARNLAWQFAVNANASRFDAEVKQDVPGDPWRVKSAWNGDWDVVNFLEENRWEATFTIPWKTLGFDGVPKTAIGFNAGRENKSGQENSQWNAYDGNFHAVEKYASLDFSNGKIERTRRVDSVSYLIDRPNAQYEALLSHEPGNFRTGTWGIALLSVFPEKIRQLYSDEEVLEWQDNLLAARGDAGMLGPPLPWANSQLKGGWAKMRELRQKYGTRFPYVLFNSAVSRNAIKAGAKYYYGETGVDPACEGYRQYVLNSLENLKTKYYYPDYLEHVGLVFGIDEPTNNVSNIFSRTRNPNLSAALDEADAEIKATTGFGKFGLHDHFAEPTADSEFTRIAFWRWWNGNFAVFCREVGAKVKEVFPGVDFKSIDRNTVSGVCPVDVALLGPHSDWISCDPYPTSTSNKYGLSRALYHPGFSAKMLGDLATGSKLCVTPQNFIYHGGRPKPAEMREWASQCIKVGAQMLYWYIEGSETLMNMWDGNLEALAINKQLKTMPKVKVPEKTVSAVLHSDYDRWGLQDNVLHPAYSLYTLLGEQTKAWFDFISPTGIATKLDDLRRYKVLYIPRMKFTDPATTAELMEFLNRGGTLVSFDPDFLSFNIDGSAVPERTALLGTELSPRTLQMPTLQYGDQTLPVYKIAHLPGAYAGKFHACDFKEVPAGSRILATYSDDGRPAVIERPYGNGKVIISAVQPFGNSDVALKHTGWVDFIRELCRAAGEETDLLIWDFVLKKMPEHQVNLNLKVKW